MYSSCTDDCIDIVVVTVGSASVVIHSSVNIPELDVLILGAADEVVVECG